MVKTNGTTMRNALLHVRNHHTNSVQMPIPHGENKEHNNAQRTSNDG
ncbi:UNVERIFIED_CONTAM: hypothetical protein NY100_03190 [Prevotella sp. 15_C9]